MLASQPRIGCHHSPCSTRTGSVALAHCPIRQLSTSHKVLVAAAGNGPVDNEDRKKADDLSERILSGEFTDSGSTKEKLTRPVRKLLAQDPVGVGELSGKALKQVRQCSRPTHAHHTPELQQPPSRPTACLQCYSCHQLKYDSRQCSACSNVCTWHTRIAAQRRVGTGRQRALQTTVQT
jgi:hypothetical protein